MKLTHTVAIDSSQETLWPLLTESEEIQRWNRDIVSDEPLTPGPPQVGARARLKIREGSRVADYESEITAIEPQRLLELELRGGSLGANPMYLSYCLTPAGRKTTLYYTVNWKPKGLMLRLMTPLLRVLSRRNIRVAMTRLKELAEATP